MSAKQSRRASRRQRKQAHDAGKARGNGKQRTFTRLAVVLLAVLVAGSAAVGGYWFRTAWRGTREDVPAPVRVPEIVRSLPHDREAFTQGLLYEGGDFYESTGLEGRSSLRRVEVETGGVTKRVDLAAKYFAEGLAAVDGQLVQLTWRNGEAFVYDKKTFDRTGEFRYEGEGWGLAFDGKRLILSDGTATLRFLDPATHAVTGTLQVTDAGSPVAMLNELEVVGKDLYANIWKEPRIARISLGTGRVLEWLDLTSLEEKVKRENPQADVLNGIAWDTAGGHLYITGKLWPYLYEIR